MMMLNERPYKPRREPRRRSRTPAVDDWDPPEPTDSYELAPDTRDVVVLGGVSGTNVVLSAAAAVVALALTALIGVAVLPFEAGAFTVGGIAARLCFVVLTGWVPFMLFCFAALPWVRDRERSRGGHVGSGVLAVPDPDASRGPLSVPLRVRFLQSHRLQLFASAVSVTLASAGLGFMATTGIVIEGHKLHGLLGSSSTFVLGAAFILTVLVGLVLPVHWWRTYRRFQAAGEKPDQLTADAEEAGAAPARHLGHRSVESEIT